MAKKKPSEEEGNGASKKKRRSSKGAATVPHRPSRAKKPDPPQPVPAVVPVTTRRQQMTQQEIDALVAAMNLTPQQMATGAPLLSLLQSVVANNGVLTGIHLGAIFEGLKNAGAQALAAELAKPPQEQDQAKINLILTNYGKSFNKLLAEEEKRGCPKTSGDGITAGLVVAAIIGAAFGLTVPWLFGAAASAASIAAGVAIGSGIAAGGAFLVDAAAKQAFQI